MQSVPAAAKAVISSLATKPIPTSSTAPSSISPPLGKRSCPLPPKRNLAPFFHNTKEVTPLRTTLEELGHPQQPTPVLVDNSTAVGLANDMVTQRCSRTIDMRFYWIHDRVNQNQFHVYWAPAHLNLADYFTKHHTPSHHRQMCKYFVYTTASPKFLPHTPT